MASRATDQKPTRRIVAWSGGDLVVTIRERTVTMRIKGTRDGGPTEVNLLWGAVYLRGLDDKVRAARKRKRSTRRGRSIRSR